MRKNLCTLIFAISIYCLGIAQTITYDFKTNEFDQPFPFDKAFKILAINIDPECARVELEIKNITNSGKIIRKIRQNSRKKNITKAEIFNHDLSQGAIYISSEPTTARDIKEKKIAVIEIAPLLPNQSYYIKIEEIKTKKLDKNQLQKIENFLIRDGIITNFSNELINEVLSPSNIRESGLDYSFISEKYKNFSQALESALKKYDHSLEVLKPENSLQLSRTVQTQGATIFIAFENFIQALNEFNDDIIRFDDSKSIDISKLFPEDLINNQSQVKNDITKEIEEKCEFILKNDQNFNKNVILSDINTFFNTLSSGVSTLNQELTNFIQNDVTKNMIAGSETLNQSYETDLVKNANTYISADLGYGYIPELNKHFGFTTANIYFRSINNSVHINHYKGFRDYTLARTSLVFGLTILGDIDKKHEREGIFEGKGVLLGIGFKALPWLKFNAGGIFYNKIVSPLVSERELGHSIFFSAAIDFSLKPTFVEALKRR